MFRARKAFNLALVDDALAEGDEDLDLLLEEQPTPSPVVRITLTDGAACTGQDCKSTVTIVDNDEAPGAPVVTATAGDGQVELSWTAPDAGTLDITGYEYRYKTTGDYPDDWTAVPDGDDAGSETNDETGVTATGLTNGTAYTFELRAVSAAGNGAAGTSAEITPTAPVAPGAPDLKAAPGDGQATLSWTAPDDGGSAITGYQYRQKAGAGAYGEWTPIPDGDDADTEPGNETAFVVGPLTNEVLHTFKLRAVSAAGPGAESAEAPVTPTPGICARTAQVRDAILARLADVSDCAAGTVADLASIDGKLNLLGKNITSLSAGDFAGLTSLTWLDLSDNPLSSLPDGVFDALTSLTDLHLVYNGLSSLPDGVFYDLTSLTRLSLIGNRLLSLPDGVFDGLTSLTELNLQENSLSSLPDGVFDGLTSLTQLDLNVNSLSSLPDGVFDDLTSLAGLNLYDNRLSGLPAGVFDGLPATLEKLPAARQRPAGRGAARRHFRAFHGTRQHHLVRQPRQRLVQAGGAGRPGSDGGAPARRLSLTARGPDGGPLRRQRGARLDAGRGRRRARHARGGGYAHADVHRAGGRAGRDGVSHDPAGHGPGRVSAARGSRRISPRSTR